MIYRWPEITEFRLLFPDVPERLVADFYRALTQVRGAVDTVILIPAEDNGGNIVPPGPPSGPTDDTIVLPNPGGVGVGRLVRWTAAGFQLADGAVGPYANGVVIATSPGFATIFFGSGIAPLFCPTAATDRTFWLSTQGVATTDGSTILSTWAYRQPLGTCISGPVSGLCSAWFAAAVPQRGVL